MFFICLHRNAIFHTKILAPFSFFQPVYSFLFCFTFIGEAAVCPFLLPYGGYGKRKCGYKYQNCFHGSLGLQNLIVLRTHVHIGFLKQKSPALCTNKYHLNGKDVTYYVSTPLATHPHNAETQHIASAQKKSRIATGLLQYYSG